MEEKETQGSKFKFLTDEDLNPDYEPKEDTGAETPPEETPPAETKAEDTGQETPPETVTGEPEPPETPPQEPKGAFVVAGRTYKTPEDLAKALENLNQKLAEQGRELGDLRKLKEEREAQPSEPDEEPPYDPYDQEAMEQWIAWKQRQEFQNLQAEREAKEAKVRQQEAVKKMLEDFASSHPDLTPDEMVEVAGYADRLMSGENIMDVAFDRWSRSRKKPAKQTVSKPEEPPAKPKMEIANRLPEKPKGGGGKGSAELTAERIDAMSLEDYGKLPRSIRDKYLAGEL